MKFIINGTEYDPILGLQKVTLATLFELKVKHGISVKDLQSAAHKLDGIKDPMALLDDAEAFQTFMVIIWLARRYAGEKLTLEQANGDFGLADLVLVNDADDPEVSVPDPKAPAGSVPAKKRRPKA